MGTSIDTAMVVVTLAAGLWWGFARRRRQDLLQNVLDRRAGSIGCHAGRGGPALAARSVAGSRCRGRGRRRFRRWRPGHSRRWRRVIGRGMLVVGLTLGGLALLTASVPVAAEPVGPA